MSKSNRMGGKMRTEHKIEVNQKFELIVEEGPYKGNYLSQVADITDDVIKVTVPLVHGEIIPLRLNLDVLMYFTGVQAAYSYKTKIIGREEEGEVPLLHLAIPEEKYRIQRREFFRLEVREKVIYRILDDSLEPVSEFKETHTIDISGGGVKMFINEPVQKGMFLELFLQIPGLENVAIISRIVNIFDVEAGLAVGIKFIEIDEYIQEEIISWLFDYQRKLRQRGLL